MVVYQADDDAGTLSGTRQAYYDHPTPPYSQSSVPFMEIDPQLELQPPSPSSLSPSLDDLRSAWFLTPDSWKIFPLETSPLAQINFDVVHRGLDYVKQWVGEWVNTGGSPFFHPELYRKVMPACVEDAFLAFSTYQCKTDQTKDIIFRLIQGKADKLVESHANKEQVNDTLEDIGRVQALLVYIIIGLFDGDIRQRHLAERYLPILLDWAREMFQHASHATSDDTLLFCNALTNFTPSLTSNPPIPSNVSPEQLLWHAWILTESVRRTWYMSMLVHAGYEMLKTGTGPCHGSILVTTRKGVWDAGTAFGWTRLCAERSVGFVTRNETEAFFAEKRIDDIDEFTVALMELDFGTERMARWQLGNKN